MERFRPASPIPNEDVEVALACLLAGTPRLRKLSLFFKFCFVCRRMPFGTEFSATVVVCRSLPDRVFVVAPSLLTPVIDVVGCTKKYLKNDCCETETHTGLTYPKYFDSRIAPQSLLHVAYENEFYHFYSIRFHHDVDLHARSAILFPVYFLPLLIF